MPSFHDLVDLKRKNFLIFDFDGTLANTSPIHQKAFFEALLPYKASFDYSKIAGLSTINAMENILDNNKISLNEIELNNLVKSKQSIAKNLIETSVKPVDGINSFISYLPDSIELGIVSSASKASIFTALNILNFPREFDPIISSEDVLNSKPSPEGFLKAIKIKNFSIDESLIIEDSNIGFQAAKASGIDYIDVRIISKSA
jgi:HAD superfamily hydrolase (TIGR01509 family)